MHVPITSATNVDHLKHGILDRLLQPSDLFVRSVPNICIRMGIRRCDKQAYHFQSNSLADEPCIA